MIRFFLSIFLYITFISVCLTSCSANGLEDVQEEAHTVMKQMTELLSRVETREELLKKKSDLKKYYDQMAKILIEANHFDDAEEDKIFLSSSKGLLAALAKVYEIDGCKEIIEQCQVTALRTLAEKNIQP